MSISYYNESNNLPPPPLRISQCGEKFLFLFSFTTRAGWRSPRQREPITVGPYYLTHPVSFPMGGNRSTRRKPTTFGRALTILFSHENWVRVHIKMNLTGDRTRNLRGERRVVWPLHHRSPKHHRSPEMKNGLLGSLITYCKIKGLMLNPTVYFTGSAVKNIVAFN